MPEARGLAVQAPQWVGDLRWHSRSWWSTGLTTSTKVYNPTPVTIPPHRFAHQRANIAEKYTLRRRQGAPEGLGTGGGSGCFRRR